MKIDIRNMRPVALSDLICSTPLGQVTTPKIIAAIQRRAGFAIGTSETIDLVRFVAWLLKNRPAKVEATPPVEPPKEDRTTDARLTKRAVKHGWLKSQRLRELAEQRLEKILSDETVSIRGSLAAVDAVLELNKQNITLEQQDRSDQSQRQGGVEDKAPDVHVHLDGKQAAEAAKDPAIVDGFSKLIGAMYRRPAGGDQPPAAGGDPSRDATDGPGNAADDRTG